MNKIRMTLPLEGQSLTKAIRLGLRQRYLHLNPGTKDRGVVELEIDFEVREKPKNWWRRLWWQPKLTGSGTLVAVCHYSTSSGHELSSQRFSVIKNLLTKLGGERHTLFSTLYLTFANDDVFQSLLAVFDQIAWANWSYTITHSSKRYDLF